MGLAPLGDVVAADADAVEVAHLLLDEVLLHIAHEPQRELGAEDAGVLRLVFFQDVGLHGAADLREGFGLDLGVDVGGEDLVAGDAEQQ